MNKTLAFNLEPGLKSAVKQEARIKNSISHYRFAIASSHEFNEFMT
jgi:hypothetical protein